MSHFAPADGRPPWSSLHAGLHRLLRQRQLLPQSARVLLAVSGGQDSLCLSQLLLDLQPKWNWGLGIAHCDHRWRPDSAANATHVASLAAQWQLPYVQVTATVPPPTEAAAREWRYQSLQDLAQTHGYTRLATGHTASDRAETLLYNLLRGSGADGLQSLVWQRPLGTDVQLVRPLLELTRQETGEFCQSRQLPVWEDSTNNDWHYRRNRIRQELLPYLREHFNPQVEQALAQTAELLQAEVVYLEAQATQLLQQALDPSGALRCQRRILAAAPLALQRRAIRQFLGSHLTVMPGFEQIEKVVALLSAPNRNCTDPLPGNVIVGVVGDWIELGQLDSGTDGCHTGG